MYTESNSVIAEIVEMKNNNNRMVLKTEEGRKMSLPKLQRDIAVAAFNVEVGDSLRLYATDVSHNGLRVRWQVVASNRDYTDQCFNAMLLGDLELWEGKAYAQALTADGEMLHIEETALKVAGLWYGVDYGDQLVLIDVDDELHGGTTAHCVGSVPTHREEDSNEIA